MSQLGIYFAHEERWPLFLVAIGIVVLMFRTAKIRRRFLTYLGVAGAENPALAFVAPRFRRLKNILFVTGMCALALAAIGPQWGQKMQSIKAEGLDICFALDLSQSMLTEDVTPNRLQQAKNQLQIFLPRLGGDRAALVAFAGSSYIATPLTVDHAALNIFLQPMNPSFISDQGTDLNGAINSCLTALGLEEITDRNQILDASAKLIMMISDGEETLEGAEQSAIKKAETLGIPIYAMAVGSVKGGPIPNRTANGQLEGYIIDPGTNRPALSRLEDGALRQLAKRTGGEVYYSTEGVDAWRKFESAITNYKRESRDAGTKLAREDRFQWPLMLAFVLLLVDFFLPETHIVWPSWKLRSWILALIACGATIHSAHAQQNVDTPAAQSPPATKSQETAPATQTVESKDPRVVYLNHRGDRDFHKKRLAEARKDFEEALARDPSDLHSRFNWATSVLHSALPPPGAKQENSAEAPAVKKSVLQEALKELKSLEKDSVAHPELSKDLRKALMHQLGQAEELNGNTPGALEYYYRSLQENTGDQRADLNIDLKNRNNIERLLQFPKGGGGGGGGQNKDDQKNSQNQGDKKDNKGQGTGDKEQQKAGQQKAEPKFTGDVNQEQAKQILESVSGEEQEVLKRKAQADAKEQAAKEGKDRRSSRRNARPW